MPSNSRSFEGWNPFKGHSRNAHNVHLYLLSTFRGRSSVVLTHMSHRRPCVHTQPSIPLCFIRTRAVGTPVAPTPPSIPAGTPANACTHRRPCAHTHTTVHPATFLSPHVQSDTCRVNASLDSRGETLGLDPDTHAFLDGCEPTCDSSECTRGFPSGYHPALEHRRQGVDDVSPGTQSE